MLKRSRMPRDANQLAKMVVDLATGQVAPDREPSTRAKAGWRGGLKGGIARAKKLPPSKRQEEICGTPDAGHVSTSYVERQNLTMRMDAAVYSADKCVQQKG